MLFRYRRLSRDATVLVVVMRLRGAAYYEGRHSCSLLGSVEALYLEWYDAFINPSIWKAAALEGRAMHLAIKWYYEDSAGFYCLALEASATTRESKELGIMASCITAFPLYEIQKCTQRHRALGHTGRGGPIRAAEHPLKCPAGAAKLPWRRIHRTWAHARISVCLLTTARE